MVSSAPSLARHSVLAGAILLGLAAPGAAQAPSTAPPPTIPCDTPAGLRPAPGSLSRALHALDSGGRLEILAVGSALVGPRPGHEDSSVPQLALARLRAALPSASLDLRLRSERGATAADMVPILRAELGRHAVPLVLWQTGTVDAARKIPTEGFAAALADGVRVVQQSGADLVLIDPQYSRLLEARADLPPYEAALVQASRMEGVAVFPRLALMRHWVESGSVDVEQAPRADRRGAVDRLHTCLAGALADFIARGAGQAIVDTPF